MRLRGTAGAVALLGLTVGCGTSAAAATPPASSTPADSTVACAAASPDAATATSEPGGELPAWQTLEIVDVDGESFTLADCIGTPVLVELFATWCSNCRQQMPKTQDAAAELGGRAAVIALSVETDLDPAAVADYAEGLDLEDIRFAVISPELLAAMVDAFGTTVANPPSTPKLVIDAGGEVVGELTTGQENADELVEKLTSAAGTPPTTAG